MATRKAKNAATAPAPRPSADVRPSTQAFFPYARYISIVGVHTSLLAFAALFLPRAGFADFASPSTARSRPKRDGVVILTESPLRTIGWMCFGALVLQVWWGSWVREWALDAIQSMEAKGNEGGVKEDSEHAKKTERRLKHRELNSQNMKAMLQAGLATLACSFIFHAVVILFGAPVLELPTRTYLLCLLLSLLTVFAPAYTLGVPSLDSSTSALVRRLTWVRLFAELSPRTPVERALVYPAIGAFLGCWSGAIPIGLDWDRPWQAWPLTPAWGAFGGYILGSLWAMLISSIKNVVELGIIAKREEKPAPQKKSKKKD